MYVVFCSYYKHAEVSCKVLANDEELRNFCLEELIQYEYNYEDNEDNETNDEKQDPNFLTLPELVALTVKEGNKQIDDELGWGLRYVFKGSNILPF